MANTKSRKSRSYISVNRQQRSLDYSLSYREFQEDGDWLAECPELQITVAGKTKRKAYETLVELIVTTLVAAIATDTITEHLIALGFEVIELPVSTLDIYGTRKRIDQDTIPLNPDYPITLPPLNQDLIQISR